MMTRTNSSRAKTHIRSSASVILALGILALLLIGGPGCSENPTVNNPNAVVDSDPQAVAELTAAKKIASNADTKLASKDSEANQDSANSTNQQGVDQADSGGGWLQSTWKGASDSGSQMATGSLDWANKTFQSLKDQGLTTADSTSDWLTEDWQNMESWEYKVVSSNSIASDDLEATLNKLGKEGWECFSIADGNMFFKKPRESYLRRLPFKDLLRLAPLLDQRK